MVEAVHSYVDELRRTALRAGEDRQPAAVADIGDPGEGASAVSCSSAHRCLTAPAVLTEPVLLHPFLYSQPALGEVCAGSLPWELHCMHWPTWVGLSRGRI